MINNLRTLFASLSFAVCTTVINAQDYPCFQTAPQIPNFSGSFVKVNPSNLAEVIDSDGSYTYNTGDVFRYVNVVTDPVNMNAYFFIESMVNATINMWDNNAAGISQRFQPRIAPSPQTMTTDQEGYIQFRIEFRENIPGLPLRNLNPGLHYRHYDIDGGLNGTTGLFTETGWTTGQSQTYVSNPTEITSGGTVNDGGYAWVKILGSTIEHTSVSSDPEVIYTSVFGPINIVRFRMGYRFIRGNGGARTVTFREYAAEFGCFDLSNNSTLPVRLLSFSGAYNGSSTQLNWTAENETRFRQYEVERSTNGKDFSTVGVLTAQGAPGVKKNYTYSDNLVSVPGNVFYYRLKMVDMDGKSVFSQTILIKRNSKAINGIVINPNPVVNGEASVRLTSQTTGTVDFKVIDFTGKVVLQQKAYVYPGNNTVAINNLNRLQPGLYMLQMADETEVVTCKFSVSR